MALRKLAPVFLTALFSLFAFASPGEAAPDLQVEIVAVDKGPPSTITVIVGNVGDSTARASKVGIILDAGVATTGLKAPTRRLAAGQEITLAIPAVVLPGLKLRAVADVENNVEESDEENNRSALWLVEAAGRNLVLVPAEPDAADSATEEAEQDETAEEAAEPEVGEPLQAEEIPDAQEEEAEDAAEPEVVDEVRPPPLRQPDLTPKVTEVVSGENGRVVVEVANRGITAAPRSRIVLLLNAEGQRSEVEAVVPKLAPGAAARVELPAALWDQMRFQVLVDPRNELAEADESNNRTAVETVEGESAPPATIAAVPDLATEILSVDPGPPLRVRAVVRNLGSLTSNATVVTLTLASGATLSQDVPPLRPGQSLEVLFEAGAPEGLVVMVDPGLAIAESDETNNRSDAAMPAEPPPAQPVETQPQPQAPAVVAGDSWVLGDIPVLVAPEILGELRSVQGFRPDAPPRQLAALQLADGSRIVFVESQLVFTGSEAEAIALAERLGGDVLRSIVRPAETGRPPTWIIAIDAGGTANLPPRGTAERAPALVSSLAALNLLGTVLQEQAAGLSVSIDPLLQPTDAFSGKTIEAKGANSSAWSYMKEEGPLAVNVVGAWRLLALAGRPPHLVKVALLDSGFGTEPDLPPFAGTTGLYDPKDVIDPGAPFHGANVASSIGALADNGIGAAGPAGSYVNLLFVQRTRTLADSIANLWEAASQGAWIINMSYTGYYPRGSDPFEDTWLDLLEQFEADAVYLFQTDRLLFASAGNDGTNVDALNADGDEGSWVSPCESQGVICVGGWHESAVRDLDSNFGEGRGETVDIYGPFEVFIGPDPFSPSPDTLTSAEGTSFASPFVAGVAALVWAANPSLTNQQVWDLLRNNITVGKDGIPMVNAYRPVRAALLMQGGNYAPHVQILAPSSGFAQARQYEPLTLSAEAVDIEDGEGCCTLVWTSDLDGQLGTGPTIAVPFAGRQAGTRLVTVTATDSGGLTAQATVTVDFNNAAPRLSIVLPAAGATFYSGFDNSFRAELFDDTVALALPLTDCTGLTWSSSNPADAKPLATGCTPTVRFGSAGTRTLTAAYTDAQGASARAHVSVTVYEPGGKGSAPIAIAITSPTPGSAFNVEMRIPLSYQLSDPGAGSTKPTYDVVWRLGRESTDMRSFTPLEDAQGSYIRILDVFPERKHDGSSAGYTLHLTVSDPARPGSLSGTSVPIGFLPALK